MAGVAVSGKRSLRMRRSPSHLALLCRCLTSRGLTVAALLFLSATLTGCSQTLYNWGDYEDSIERLYDTERTFVPADEIENLASELQDVPPAGIPPGKAAYIGYLHSLQGNSSQAVHYFQLEKRLFPESVPLMDRLIASMQPRDAK
jgi:hypothetical protein